MRTKVKFFYVDDITKTESLATVTGLVNNFISTLVNPDTAQVECHSLVKSSLVTVMTAGTPPVNTPLTINSNSAFINVKYTEPV